MTFIGIVTVILLPMLPTPPVVLPRGTRLHEKEEPRADAMSRTRSARTADPGNELARIKLGQALTVPEDGARRHGCGCYSCTRAAALRPTDTRCARAPGNRAVL